MISMTQETLTLFESSAQCFFCRLFCLFALDSTFITLLVLYTFDVNFGLWGLSYNCNG